MQFQHPRHGTHVITRDTKAECNSRCKSRWTFTDGRRKGTHRDKSGGAGLSKRFIALPLARILVQNMIFDAQIFAHQLQLKY